MSHPGGEPSPISNPGRQYETIPTRAAGIELIVEKGARPKVGKKLLETLHILGKLLRGYKAQQEELDEAVQTTRQEKIVIPKTIPDHKALNYLRNFLSFLLRIGFLSLRSAITSIALILSFDTPTIFPSFAGIFLGRFWPTSLRATTKIKSDSLISNITFEILAFPLLALAVGLR